MKAQCQKVNGIFLFFHKVISLFQSVFSQCFLTLTEDCHNVSRYHDFAWGRRLPAPVSPPSASQASPPPAPATRSARLSVPAPEAHRLWDAGWHRTVLAQPRLTAALAKVSTPHRHSSSGLAGAPAPASLAAVSGSLAESYWLAEGVRPHPELTWD